MFSTILQIDICKLHFASLASFSGFTANNCRTCLKSLSLTQLGCTWGCLLSLVSLMKRGMFPDEWGQRQSLLLLLLSHFSRVRLCTTPETAAPQAPPSLGFSRQEHWSGLPFPSPMHENEKWKWSRSVVSDPQWPHGLQPTRLLRPRDFPGKSTITTK